jgi:large subunit ribosomal protein L24
MKKKFNLTWNKSKKPRKQRKYLANAPLHIKRKLLSVNLSKELRKKYNMRNIPVRKNDVLKVLRGKYKKKSGKVIDVYTKRSFITIEGLQSKKQDGSKVNFKFRPSNLQIIELNLEDKKRIKKMNNSKKTEKEESKNPTKNKSTVDKK